MRGLLRLDIMIKGSKGIIDACVACSNLINHKRGGKMEVHFLLNTYQYNDNREYTSIKPFKDDVTQISLINAANEKNTFTIGGILEQADLKEYGFWELTPYPVRIVVPDADARSCDWFSMPSDEDDYTEYARSVMDEYFPIAAEDSYVEQGYTVRIARTDAMVKNAQYSYSSC